MWDYTAYSLVLADGEYEVEILRATHTVSARGFPMVKVVLRVGGKMIWDHVVMSERTQQYAREFRDAFMLGDPFSSEIQQAVGRKARAVVYIDYYQGKPWNKISRYLADAGTARSKSPEPQPIVNFLP